jgi:hypothetical protein
MSPDSVCAMCGQPWVPGQRTCPACGSASRRRVPPSTIPRFFTAGMTEQERVPYGDFGISLVIGVLGWLVKLPFRIRAYRRNAGLWPERER